MVIPRCDADISTRSRFFKHLEELELDLKLRLVGFENELADFELDDLIQRPFSNSLHSSESGDLTEHVNNDKSKEIDEFLNSIKDLMEDQREERHSTSEMSISSESSCPKETLSNVNEKLTDGNSNGNLNCNSLDDSSSDCESSDNSLPFAPPKLFKRKGPFVKSILMYEQEAKLEQESKFECPMKRKYEPDTLDQTVVINQIVGTETKFLCFLNEI